MHVADRRELGVDWSEFLGCYPGCNSSGALLCCDISPWKQRKTYHTQTEGVSLEILIKIYHYRSICFIYLFIYLFKSIFIQGHPV